MALENIPSAVRRKYHIEERGHASAILASDFPREFADIMDCLREFVLRKSHILTPGGGRSPISAALDGFFHGRGWHEKSFDIKITIDGNPVPIPTHKIDNFKNKVGLEIEWNNKTEFYDRDLNNFRLLFDLRVLSVGIIITRCDELQDIFDSIGRGSSYGQSTTILSKLMYKISGGSGGGCPILV